MQNDKALERSIKEWHATLLWAMEKVLSKVYSVRGNILWEWFLYKN